jgi:hypothetical protein
MFPERGGYIYTKDTELGRYKERGIKLFIRGLGIIPLDFKES